MKRISISILVLALMSGQAAGETLGSETQRPLPRFVSMKASEANVRRGPSLTHRVDWVFRHRGQPLMVTAEYGHWRRVRDRDGIGGWIHYAMLSGARTAVVTADMTELRRTPDGDAPVVARVEQNAVVRIAHCSDLWCRVSAGSYSGWADVRELWGATAPESD